MATHRQAIMNNMSLFRHDIPKPRLEPEDYLEKTFSDYLSCHPTYMIPLIRAHNFIMRDLGPLSTMARHYIALLAASRHRCSYLVSISKKEFLHNGGDPDWLRNYEKAPLKLRSLQTVNKILAHQPWLLKKSHIESLVKGPYQWSLSELTHAIIIMVHFHALCSLSFGCKFGSDKPENFENEDNDCEEVEIEELVYDVKGSQKIKKIVKRSPASKLIIERCRQLELENATLAEIMTTRFNERNARVRERAQRALERASRNNNPLNPNSPNYNPNFNRNNNNNNNNNAGNAANAEGVENADNAANGDNANNASGSGSNNNNNGRPNGVKKIRIKNKNKGKKNPNQNQNNNPSTSSSSSSTSSSVSDSSSNDSLLLSTSPLSSTGSGGGKGSKGGKKQQQAKAKQAANAAATVVSLPPGSSAAIEAKEGQKLISLAEEEEAAEAKKKSAAAAAVDVVPFAGCTWSEDEWKRNAFDGIAADPTFGYIDFASRDKQKSSPTFRIQDYQWDDQGYSLCNLFYSDISQFLDEKFKVGYNLTYYTLGPKTNIDTSPFRRAIWNYIQCIYGMRHDDYNYREVNILLERNLKCFIKNLACYPERVPKQDFADVMQGFRPSEKIHVIIMVSEARLQTELLYALRTITEVMKTSS